MSFIAELLALQNRLVRRPHHHHVTSRFTQRKSGQECLAK